MSCFHPVCPQNVGTTQAQYDLLQSYTEVTPASETVRADSRTPVAAGQQCGYCSKAFKTSGGLNRHVSLVRTPPNLSQWSDNTVPLLNPEEGSGSHSTCESTVTCEAL